MSDVTAYEASSLDWTALRALAQRVAQETPLKAHPRIVYFNRKTDTNVDVLGPHWLLDCRFENYEERPNDAVIEEGHLDVVYALLPDGQLMYVSVAADDRVSTRGAWTKFTDDHSVRPMNDSDVQAFDFETKYHEHGYGTDRHIWGTTDRSWDRGKLLHDAKGAGLSALLQAVRTGSAKLPAAPSRFQTTNHAGGPPPAAQPDTHDAVLIRALGRRVTSQMSATQKREVMTRPDLRAIIDDSLAKQHGDEIDRDEKLQARLLQIFGRIRTPTAPTPTAPSATPPPSQPDNDRSTGDLLATLGAGALAITVLVPFLIGHFLLTKTFVLKPNAGVYDGSARGILDHFFATYLAGLVPIALALGIFLVARRPWQGRAVAVVGGAIVLIGSLVILLPMAMSKWNGAEQKTIAKLRETAYPFSAHYYTCANWTIHAENGVHDPELWQVHLAQVKGTYGDGCNRVWVYRGWQPVSNYDLPGGDVFTGEAIVNHFNWPSPVREQGTGEFSSTDSATGASVPMNPMGTNFDLPTANGQVLSFTLDVASTDGFKLH